MSFKSTITIYLKEMKDILRDRRTILSMILVPILLMPIMSIGVAKFMHSHIKKIQEERSIVAWIAPASMESLKRELETADGIDLLFEVADTAIAIDLVRGKDIDALVYIPDDFEESLRSVIGGAEEAEPPKVYMYLDETRERSQFAMRKVTAVVDNYRSNIIINSLNERGLSPNLMKPFWMMRTNIASAEDMGNMIAGMILPYIIILMALTGAMYPAVDLTAGEKERGTLETLLVSGVSRVDIVLGKFLTVFTASLVTAVLSIGSMAAMGMGLIGTTTEIANELNFNVQPGSVLLIIAAMIPLGAIFSALLMTLALFAKSYKEAQSYISPLMILVILPAMASLVPEVEFNVHMAMIPVLNVSLFMKEALRGSIETIPLIVTLIVNFAFAILCLFLVFRMFKRESVLFRI